MRNIVGITLIAIGAFTAGARPVIARTAPAQSTVMGSDASGSAEEEIKKEELKRADLIVHEKWDEYEKYLADDYTRISSGGTLEDKKEVMAGFRSGPRKVIVREPEDLHVRIYGETAILQGQRTSWVREAGRVNTRRERFTEVLIKRDGQWMLVAEHETNVGK
jgi:hypothetical protein